MPIVAVVIPTFKEDEMLRRCLDNLEKQTLFKDSEIIIADYDPDDTHVTANAIAEYQYVKYAEVKQKGIGHARNAGIQACTAPVIINFDADCIFDRLDAMELMINPILTGEVVLTHADSIFDDAKNVIPKIGVGLLNFGNSLGITAQAQGLTIARYAYNKVGGFPEIKMGEDWGITSRIVYEYGLGGKRHVDAVKVIMSARRVNALFENPLSISMFNYDKAFRNGKELDI